MEKDRLYEIIRFALVGGASFVVDYAMLYICTEWLGIHYLYSAAISFTVSVIVNYWLCVVFVFRGGRKADGTAGCSVHRFQYCGVGHQPGMHVAVRGKIRLALYAGQDWRHLHRYVLELHDETEGG